MLDSQAHWDTRGDAEKGLARDQGNKKGALVTMAEMQKINDERKRAKVKEDKWKDAMANNRRDREGKRRRDRYEARPLRRERKRDRMSTFFGYDRYREQSSRDRGRRGRRRREHDYQYSDYSDYDTRKRRHRREDREWRDDRYRRHRRHR